MKHFLLILFSLALLSCNQVKDPKALSIDVSKDIVIPKHYIITKTTNDISIDGNADEESWNMAKFSDKFIDIEGVKPQSLALR